MKTLGVLLASDFQNGLRSVWKIVLCQAVLIVLVICAMYLRVGELATYDSLSLSDEFKQMGPWTLGDVLAYLFMGMGVWDSKEGIAFHFPVAWMMLLGTNLFLTLRYPYRDLHGMGMYMLVRGGSRWKWWLSKCVWVVAVSLTLPVLALLASFAWSVCVGAEQSFSLSDSVCALLQQEPSVRLEHPKSIAHFFIASIVVIASLSLLQLALSLLARPIMSFACCFSLLFMSAAIASPYLAGNYLMSMRSTCLMTAGMRPFFGILIAGMLALAAVVLGGLVFSRMDIVGKEFDS